MPDERLRALERRWRETGAEEDEVALLAERLRAGRLDPARARLAVLLGCSRTARALGSTEPPPSAAVLAGHLGASGAVTLGRAVVAVARATSGAWRDDGAPPEAPARFERALAAAEAWVVCPCDAHEDAAVREGRAAIPLAGLGALADDPAGRAPWALAGELACCAAELPSLFDETDPAGFVTLAGLDEASSLVGVVALRRALHDDLVPWLLGHGDPVRARVARRGR